MLQVSDLQKRIQSFDFYNWPFTSLKISPYRCAIYGFSCVKMNEIRCELCNEHIVASPDVDIDDNKVNQLAEKLKKQHTSDCFYLNADKIDLPRVTTAFLFQYWDTYYQENSQTFDGYSEFPIISSSIKAHLSKDVQEAIWHDNTTAFREGVIDAGTLLAIFGWRYQLEGADRALADEDTKRNHTNLLCAMCGRKIRLNSYPITKSRVQDLEDTLPGFSGEEKGKHYGWSVCCEMLKYSSKKKHGEHFDKVSADVKQGEEMNIESISPNEKISGELTKFKLDIVNNIQELRNKKDHTLRCCDDILKKAEVMGIEETPELKDKLKQHRQKLDELIEGLDISFNSYKKVKLSKNPSQGPK